MHGDRHPQRQRNVGAGAEDLEIGVGVATFADLSCAVRAPLAAKNSAFAGVVGRGKIHAAQLWVATWVFSVVAGHPF